MSRIEITTTIALSPRLTAKILQRYEVEHAVDPSVTLDRVVETYVLAGLARESLREQLIEREVQPPTPKKKGRAAR